MEEATQAPAKTKSASELVRELETSFLQKLDASQQQNFHLVSQLNDKLNKLSFQLTKMNSEIFTEETTASNQPFRLQLTNEIFRSIMSQTQLNQIVTNLESKLASLGESQAKIDKQIAVLAQIKGRDESVTRDISDMQILLEKLGVDFKFVHQSLDTLTKFQLDTEEAQQAHQ